MNPLLRSLAAPCRRALALLVLGLLLLRPASADEGAPASFPSPEEAAKAVAAACEADDPAALVRLFGRGSEDLVDTGDRASDVAARRRFVVLARQALRVEASADGRTAQLLVGHARWPFPVPLVKEAAGWRFDAVAAREEILARRIGANELSAIALCRAYGPAQRAYAEEDRDGDGCLEYAQRLRSTEGARDGLHWPTAEGEAPSPFGPLVAAAGVSLEDRRPGDPWKGYHFRILTQQGANAPGGAFAYLGPKGDMLGGYALLAWPAAYRSTGVMTFLVGREGRVLQKDLGPTTAEAVAALTSFDPDATWTLVPAE